MPSRLSAIRDAFAAHGIADASQTREPGDEENLAMRAIDEGITTLIAVGGDGTSSRIADAIIRSDSECRLAVVPCGTGNDFAKTLGVDQHSANEIADLVAGGVATRIDVGWADGHHFLNCCGFGFDASVLETSNDVRFLRGEAVYVYSALRQLFGYVGIEISADGEAAVQRARMLMVTVSNGRSLGGAFRIAPRASVLDGKLDACFIADTTVLNRIKLFFAAVRGTHLAMPGVTAKAVKRLALSFSAAPTMEIDGELRIARERTVELKCIPRALPVIAAPGALV